MRTLPFCLLTLIGVVGAANTFQPLSAAETAGKKYAVQKQFTVGGDGSWDYLVADPAANRLFVTRSDRVMVLNTLDGSLVETIGGTSGVHGVALVKELGKGFTSNGRSDSVTVFDLASLKVEGSFDVKGHNPDAILYDRASKKLYTFNGRSNDVSVIDPLAGKVAATIPVGGRPEFAVTDDAGRIFFNVEDKGQLAAIDTRLNKIVANWPLANCEEPSGLAFDSSDHRLFSVCSNGVMVVTDSVSGKNVAQVPIGKGADAVAYDAERKLIFSPNGDDGTLTVVHQDDRDHYSVVTNLPTQKSARTLTLDAQSHRLYLVAAEFGPKPAPSKETPHPRPPVVAGSFKVLVVGD